MNCSSNDKVDESLLADQVAEESAMAHRNLRRYFESIERAVEADQFEDGAHLLSELISVAREHFTNAESIAHGGGKQRSAGGSLLHKAFVNRARILQARCQNTAATPHGRADIRNELVLLLSDMVESDLRIQKRIDGAPNIKPA